MDDSKIGREIDETPAKRPPDALFKADRATVVFDAQKNGTLRVTYQGWDDAKVILPGERFELVWEGGQVWAFRGVR